MTTELFGTEFITMPEKRLNKAMKANLTQGHEFTASLIARRNTRRNRRINRAI